MARRKKTAVVLIHMQADFLRSFDDESKNELIEKHIEAIKFCRGKDIPIFLVEYPHSGQFDPRILKALDGYQYLIHGFGGDNVFATNEFAVLVDEQGNFRCGSLAMRIRRITRAFFPKIFLMGINASACVKRSAQGARDKWLPVYTSLDTMADPFAWDKENRRWFKWHTVLRKNWRQVLK